MQRMAGAYLVKRLGDELMPKPAPAASDEGNGEEKATDDGLDGQVVRDEEGRAIGTAHRLPGVAVYVAFDDGYETPQQVLARCLEEPEPTLLLQREGRRIVGLIYVPDPSLAPKRPEGFRADEV